MSTDALLEERKKTHGDYREHAGCTQQMLSCMKNWPRWKELNACQRESLHMIAHKIGRILTGDPNVADHWDDIAGYARLISQQLGADIVADRPTRLVPRYRPGTPEDGGHHARQQEMDEDAGS